ncbi:MAG: PVC-type heme-binding CxxCH protein [Planctomycetota bacterium]
MKLRLLLSSFCLAALFTLPCVRGFAQASDEESKPVYNSEKEPGDPLSAEQALRLLKLPEAFSATVFASEPDVMNPIAATTDAQGRVWVAENFTYAERGVRFDMDLNDRVIVLEDSDDDGIADQRRVFADGLKVLTGITVGRGGVWLMAPPQLLFIPDVDGDLVPDGPPQVKLDGFRNARENHHNFANGLSWGPDGWLYGRCGASAPGEAGIPGCLDSERIAIRGGMWRYHPERQVVESLVQGTTNPWGNDWNAHGDLFFINTVNGHFWHCIPGAHFVRPHTLDVNPLSYELIDMHADHWHFDTGKSWTASRGGAANDFGGGHAHIGMMIYQEQTWPKKYHGKVMTVNMHGRRVNVESLKREGSGYVASHQPDFVISDDTWFRGMELLPLPDGNVLLVDWSDTGECHEHTGVHRTSGRIFKISYTPQGGSSRKAANPLVAEDLRNNPQKLVEVMLSADSEWLVRRCRETLTQLALNGRDCRTAKATLMEQLKNQESSVVRRLRALWGLVAIDACDENTLLYLSNQEDENLRVWAVRLLVDPFPLDTAYGERPARTMKEDLPVKLLLQIAAAEKSSKVRLELASALQRLPVEARVDLALYLVRDIDEAADHNLPLMVWYGLIPVRIEDLDLSLFINCKWPTTRRLIARRIAEQSKVHPRSFTLLFGLAVVEFDLFRDAVHGTSEALAGWSSAKAPSSWRSCKQKFSGEIALDKELARQVQTLDVLFGDGRTMEQLMAIAKDGKMPLERRKSALSSLVDASAKGTKELCLNLLSTRFLNLVAARGLAKESDPAVGDELVKRYRRFHPSERPQVISILCSRASWAEKLLQSVSKGQIDRSEVSAFQARQIASHQNATVDRLLAENWGQIRSTPEDKRELIEKLRKDFSQASQIDGNKLEGRKLFEPPIPRVKQNNRPTLSPGPNIL